MKVQFCCAVLSIALSCSRFAHGGEVTVPGDIAITEYKSAAAGIVVVAGAPLRVDAGMPVPLVVTVLNNGIDTVVIGETGYFAECSGILVDLTNGGRVCPYTTFGKFLLSDGSKDYAGYALTRIEPGKSKSWRIDLTTCYELDAGRYEFELAISAFDSKRKKSVINIEKISLDLLGGRADGKKR